MNEILKKIRALLKPTYLALNNLRLDFLDIFDYLLGRKDPLIPPRKMIFIGDGDYRKIGWEFFNYFKELGNLKQNHNVLDIGCGIGRMALPLVTYLNQDGAYYGFDIVKEGIDWCKNNITKRHPNFTFKHSDIYNKCYNPKGSENSLSYTFKYQDSFFDFAFLTSVFTHMMKEDVEHYLQQIHRVLKNDGNCLTTFFLINEESHKLINENKSTQNLKYPFDDVSFVLNKEIPEYAIGFEEKWLINLLEKYQFEIKGIYYGSWCGRKDFKSYQDIVLIKKRTN